MKGKLKTEFRIGQDPDQIDRGTTSTREKITKKKSMGKPRKKKLETRKRGNKKRKGPPPQG